MSIFVFPFKFIPQYFTYGAFCSFTLSHLWLSQNYHYFDACIIQILYIECFSICSRGFWGNCKDLGGKGLHQSVGNGKGQKLEVIET